MVSGIISYDFGDEEFRSINKNLIYTVEISCALEREQRAIRVTLYDQVKMRTIISVVFMDQSLYSRDSLAPDINFGIKSGFVDSIAIL